jgi:hypothetical protein
MKCHSRSRRKKIYPGGACSRKHEVIYSYHLRWNVKYDEHIEKKIGYSELLG